MHGFWNFHSSIAGWYNHHVELLIAVVVISSLSTQWCLIIRTYPRQELVVLAQVKETIIGKKKIIFFNWGHKQLKGCCPIQCAWIFKHTDWFSVLLQNTFVIVHVTFRQEVPWLDKWNNLSTLARYMFSIMPPYMIPFLFGDQWNRPWME